MKHIYQIIIVFIYFFSHTILAQNYVFEEIPEWVKKIDTPNESSVSKYDILSGYYLTLVDYQVNLEEEAVFNHEVINVISYSGISNASQLSVIYDTTYQELQVHHLYIWRKGKKIDRTNDLSLEIMNNEYNLHQGVYIEQITAYDILNDVRKDDLIDFAYTLVGNNPIFDKEKYLFIPLEMMNPVDLYSVRILYPNEKDYTYECVDCDSLSFSISEIDNNKVIEIRNENVKTIELEDFTPSWSIPYKYFTLSSFHSWIDVNKWAQKVFALNEEPELDNVFNEIFTGEETTDDKINKIIDYVQNDIRYMGIESGIGSIKPFPPEQVVNQRFGDCKDKSLLLVSLLKKIGIEKSFPALVNVFMLHDVDKLYPSNQVFNHSIVRFDYNDSLYWVDPSIAQQGGDFRNLYINDYGKALIIGIPADTLHNMSPRKTETRTDIVEELTINSFTEPSGLIITSNRYGFEADQRRLLMEYYTTKDITNMVTKDLRLLFPIVNRTEEIIISDDMEKNNFSITYKYEVDDFWEDGDKGTNVFAKGLWMFKFEPLLLYQYLNVTACEDREFDYEINFPLNLNYRVIFHFPEDLLIQDDIDIFENEAFYFEEKFEQLSSNSLQIDYSFRTKTNCIKAENYKGICDQKNTIAKNLPVIIYFYK
jgi:hypothetical protein